MTGNVQKTPLVDSLSRFAEGKVADAGQNDPKSLPCSVTAVVSSGIVTVKFEVQSTSALGATLPNTTVAVAWPEYVRYPVQVGDRGFCVAADAYLGGVTGLGGGVASLVQQGNLSALAFQPLGNTNWTKTPNANAVVVYGVAGGGVALYSDIAGQAVSLVLTKTGITITGNVTLNGNLVLNGTQTTTGATTATGDVTAGQGTGDRVDLQQHIHPVGTSSSGPPTPGS